MPSSMEVKHFTAWLVNDRTCLDQDYMDVTILQDMLVIDGPDHGGRFREHWETDPEEAPAYYAITTVNAREGDIEEGQKQAKALLADAGWQTVDDWTVLENAYTITVEFSR